MRWWPHWERLPDTIREAGYRVWHPVEIVTALV
jgi:hypothetical protein